MTTYLLHAGQMLCSLPALVNHCNLFVDPTVVLFTTVMISCMVVLSFYFSTYNLLRKSGGNPEVFKDRASLKLVVVVGMYNIVNPIRGT